MDHSESTACHDLWSALVHQDDAGLRSYFAQHPKQLRSFVAWWLRKGDADLAVVTERVRNLCIGTGGVFDPATFLARLEAHGGSLGSSSCGAVWGRGDYCYHCLDCEADPTCALCVDCFEPDKHVGHDYRMAGTYGGVCDCGDPTAWSPDGFCSKHAGAAEEIDVDANLPNDLVEPTRALIGECLHALTDALKPFYSRPRVFDMSNPAAIMSDDSTSYSSDEIILDTDEGDEGDDEEEADEHDDDGGGEEGDDDNEEGDQGDGVVVNVMAPVVVPDAVAGNGGIEALGGPAIVEAIRSRLQDVPIFRTWLSHDDIQSSTVEEFAVVKKRARILMDVVEPFLSSYGDVVRRLVVEEWLCARSQVSNPALDTHLGFVMSADLTLPKKLSARLHEFYFLLLQDVLFKKHFAIHLTRMYAACSNVIRRQGRSSKKTLLEFSVQVFTVPQLTPMLCSEHGLLRVVLDQVIACLNPCRAPCAIAGHVNRSVLKLNDPILTNRRYWRSTTDLAYCLSVPQTGQHFLFREPKTLDAYLNMLAMVQGCHLLLRKRGEHVLFENTTYHVAAQLELDVATAVINAVMPCMRLGPADVDQGLVDNEAFRVPATPELLAAIRSLLACAVSRTHAWITRCLYTVPAKKSVCGIGTKRYRLSVMAYNDTTDAVTLTLPLHRFLAAALHQGMSVWGLSVAEMLPPDTLPESFGVLILEDLLRAVLFEYGVFGGLWRRNGYRALEQASIYSMARASDARDRDHFLLQCCCVLVNEKAFLCHAYNKFGVAAWWRALKHDINDRATQALKQRLGHFLHFIVRIVTNRTLAGARSTEDTLRLELVHALAHEPAPFSSLRKGIPKAMRKHASLETVLEEVAVFARPDTDQEGKFSLRASCWNLWTPYWPRYTPEQQAQATENWTQHQRKTKSLAPDAPVALPIPSVEPILGPLQRVLSLACLPPLLDIAFAALQMHDHDMVSDLALQCALHVVALASSISSRQQEHAVAFVEYMMQPLALQYSDASPAESPLLLLHRLKTETTFSHQVPNLELILSAMAATHADVRAFLEMKGSRCHMDESSDSGEPAAETAAQRRERLRAKAKARRQAIMDRMKSSQAAFATSNTEALQRLEEEAGPVTNEVKGPGYGEACVLCREGCSDYETHPMAFLAHVIPSTMVAESQRQCLAGAPPHYEVESESKAEATPEDAEGSEGEETVPVGSSALKRSRTSRITAADDETAPTSNRGEEDATDANLSPWSSAQHRLWSPVDSTRVAHVNKCGHVMHFACFNRFISSVRSGNRLQDYFSKGLDVERGEFLCPLCSRLANAVIPLPCPSAVEMAGEEPESLASGKADCGDDDAMCLEWLAAAATPHSDQDFGRDDTIMRSSQGGTELEVAREAMLNRLHNVALDYPTSYSTSELAMSLWLSCTASIASAEVAMRMVESITEPSHKRQRQLSHLPYMVVHNRHLLEKIPGQHQRLHDTVLACASGRPQAGDSVPPAYALQPFGLLVALCMTYVGDVEPKQLRTECRTATPWTRHVWASVRATFALAVAQAVHRVVGSEALDQEATSEEEWALLSPILGLPSGMDTLLATAAEDKASFYGQLFEAWASQLEAHGYKDKAAVAMWRPAPSLRVRLLELPSCMQDKSFYLYHVRKRQCPTCGTVPKKGALCLVCGAYVCADSVCCRRNELGECHLHATECHEGSCVFLDMRTSLMYLFRPGAASAYHSVYLDAHGESDLGLNRGKPLTLNAARYEALRMLWVDQCMGDTITEFRQLKGGV